MAFRVSMRYTMNSNGRGGTSRSHIERRAGAVDRERLVHLIPVLSTEYLLPSRWVPVLAPTYLLRIGVYTVPKYGTKTYPICNFRDRRGAASLPHRNLAEITVLVCEQKPYPYFCGREAMQYSLNIALC